jgi:Na+/melibiose symporter-like transporter
MIVLGLISCLSFWGLFATAKEKYIAPVSDTPLTQDLKKILRHKELSPFVIVWIMASMGYGLMFASSVFYVMYFLGRPDLISIYMLVVSMGALVSMVVLMPICMRIFKTAQRTLVVTQIAAIICYVTLFFVGNKNMMLLYVITFIATSVASMSNALVNVLVNDAIDYVQFKDGITANGVISSIKGFAQKCGNTVTNSGILAVLAWAGYRAGEIGNQPESTMFAINFLRFGAPALISGILLIALKFNPVEKHRADILEMKELIRDHSEDNHDA